ncbi:UBN [Lepeophtheirus salmonis]|uniref:UBN n=1 Tax=Lepeophtheirus salmonis TaxID=72036 RepID=A0A7R8CUM3_LEPSM|nr:UBN [Lepeophtheirus salmonis]CAF2937437.1 UBN [Lepeophtheirus salmonis]
MVEGEEDSGAPCSMVVGAKKKVKTKEMKKTFSFILELKDLSSKEYNEFNWLDLVAQEEEKSKRVLFPANDLQDDEECKALARKYEAKYGVEAIKKKKKVRKLDDYADLGYGYDSNDPFIDNSDVYDEIVPRDVTTAYGGFYVNSGPLEFKERESANEESDPDTSKNILSVPSTTKKRKRPKKDIESNTPMSSKTQELPSKKINRKETNSKSSNRSKKRNLDGNVTKNSKANNNSDKPKKKKPKNEVQDTQLQLLAATVKETIKNIPLPSKNNVSSTTSSTPTANSLSVNSPTTQSLTPSTTSSSAKSKKSHSSANKVSSKKQHPLSQPNFDVNSYSDGLKVKSTAEQLNVLAKSSAISVTKQSVSGGGSKNSQSYVDVINSITGSNSKTLNEAAKSYLEFANALAVATSASQNSYPNHIVSPSVATASKQLPGSVTVESLSHKGKSPKVQVPNKSLSPMSRSGGIKSSTSHSNNSDINSVSIQSMPGKQMQQHFKSSSPHVTITKSSNANISSSNQIKKLQSPPQNANPFSLDQCKNANNSDNPKQFQEHLHKPDQEKVRQQLKLEQETQRQIKQDQERQRQQVKQEQEKHRQRQQQISLEKEKQRQQQIKQDQELQIQQKIKQEQERQRQHQLKQEQERQRQQQLKQEQERQRQQQLKQEQERQRQQQLKQEQERQRQQQLKQEQERQLKQEQEQQERQLKQEQERQRQHQLKQEQERQRQHQLKQEQERQRQQQLKQEQERQRQQQIKQEQERQRQQQLKQEQERKRQQQIKHEQERKLQQQIIQEHERQLQQQLKQEQERQRQISLEKERQRQQQIKEHERQRQQQLKQDQERQRQFQQQQHQEIFKQQQMQIHQEQVQQQFLLQQTASPFMVQSPNYGNSVPASSSSKTSNSLSFMQQPPLLNQFLKCFLPFHVVYHPHIVLTPNSSKSLFHLKNSVISGLHITSPPPSATNSTTFYVPK